MHRPTASTVSSVMSGDEVSSRSRTSGGSSHTGTALYSTLQRMQPRASL